MNTESTIGKIVTRLKPHRLRAATLGENAELQPFANGRFLQEGE